MHAASESAFRIASDCSKVVGDAMWGRAVCSNDVDGHVRAQPQWSLQCDQLSCGVFKGYVHHVQLPGLRLIFEESSQAIHQHGSLAGDTYTFGMAVHQHGPAYFNGQELESNDLMLGSGDELDLCSPVNFGLIAIVVDKRLLDALVSQVYGRHAPPHWSRHVVAKVEASRAALLRNLHLDAMSEIRSRSQLLSESIAAIQLRDCLLLEWLGVLPLDFDLSLSGIAEGRRRIVQRVCDLMLAAPGEPPSLDDACARIGASRRKLEGCFKSALGFAPSQYLRAVRLNGARRELRRSRIDDVNVVDVAERWGFGHQSEFASLYRRQFGELPSSTLRSGTASVESLS